MNRLNAAINAIPESNGSQTRFHRRWPLFSTCALFLMLMLLASSAAYAATYTVTDLTDNAADTGSLRYAVNTAVNGDTINFVSGLVGTITLTNGTLTINSDVTITGPGPALLTISGNNTVAVFTINATGTVNISGLTIANGKNSNNGGGIAHIGPGTWAVSYCAFYSNATGAGGAGIANGGALTVENSTFYGNTGALGGGGLFNNGGGTATVENSTFFGNSSPGGPGGGIFNNGTMTVSNSTVTGNADSGIFNNGGGPTVTVSNSIVAGNTGGDCNQCGTQGSNNLIGGSPNLGPLQYNGGDTQTMMPLPGSPAIGAGTGNTLAIDQRGFARPTSGPSDLGAVQTKYLTVTTLADSTNVGTCTGGAICSLRDAMALANSAGSGDIVFQSGLTGTITLGSVLPSITANMDIVGPGANRLTISGAGNFGVMDVLNTNIAVNLRGITVADGNAPTGAGGIFNRGRLSVEDSSFSSNSGHDGGAIFNNGVLGVENSSFFNNDSISGGGINSSSTLVVANSTFTGNQDNGGNGGGVGNSGGAIVYNSTISGNHSVNNGTGAGMGNSSGSLTVVNSIVAANTVLNGNTEDDCNNCTQVGPMLTGANPGLGTPAYNGLNAAVQTMLPLPGSPAIQAGDVTLLPAGLTADARGFARLTGGKLDLGAAQTNYTSVQFVQQPTNTVFNADISPAVTLEVLETNTNLSGPNDTDAVDGIPITLTLNGSGTLGGTLTQTTSGAVASFGNLTVNTVGTGDTLATSLTVTPPSVTPAQTLTATSNPFDVTLQMQTITFTPPPANVTYGVSPIALSATSSAGLPVTFQVDSGPAALTGNALTITGAGTVVVEADAAGNTTYAAASPVTKTILVAQAASQLTLTASATQANPGSSVTLTATATSSAGVPTGTVTFKTGTMTLGTATLNAQGVATLTVTTLPVGSNTITASYPGDANHLGSNAQLAGTIIVGTPGFTMTSNIPGFSISPGQQQQLVFTLTPTFGYTGTVTFACSNLPTQSQCAFSPTSVTFNGSGNAIQVNLTMTIGSPRSSVRKNTAKLLPWKPLGGLPVVPAMFFWLPGTENLLEERYGHKQSNRTKNRSKSARMLLMVSVLALSAGFLALVGCGGSTPYIGPAPGQQTVTITATGSGGITQSVPVQVTIQ